MPTSRNMDKPCACKRKVTKQRVWTDNYQAGVVKAEAGDGFSGIQVCKHLVLSSLMLT